MLGARLRNLRKQKGLKQKDLAEMTHINAQNIARYENAESSTVKTTTLEKLAKALNTTTDFLLGLTDNVGLDLFEINEEDTVKVPIYGQIPAGRPIEALQVDCGYIEYSASHFKGGKQFIGLKVKGNSMYPFYMEGDTVIIEITPEAQSGDDVVVFIGYDNEATLKKFHQKEDHIELEPINREYSIRKFYKNDQPIRILGVVRELRREVS